MLADQTSESELLPNESESLKMLLLGFFVDLEKLVVDEVDGAFLGDFGFAVVAR